MKWTEKLLFDSEVGCENNLLITQLLEAYSARNEGKSTTERRVGNMLDFNKFSSLVLSLTSTHQLSDP